MSRLGVYYGEWREDWTDWFWMPNWPVVQRATERQMNPRWRACEPPEPTQGKWSLCICCLSQQSSVHWEYSVPLFVCQAIHGDVHLLAVTVPVRDVWLMVQANGGVLLPQMNSTTILAVYWFEAGPETLPICWFEPGTERDTAYESIWGRTWDTTSMFIEAGAETPPVCWFEAGPETLLVCWFEAGPETLPINWFEEAPETPPKCWLRQDLRHCLYAGLRQDLRHRLYVDLRQDLIHHLCFGLRQDLRPHLYADLRQDRRHCLCVDLGQDLRHQLCIDLRQDLRHSLYVDLRHYLGAMISMLLDIWLSVLYYSAFG